MKRFEVISAATIIVVLGWVWWASARAKTWDVVSDPRKGNDALDVRVVVLETHVKDKDDEVMRQLGFISRKLDKIH